MQKTEFYHHHNSPYHHHAYYSAAAMAACAVAAPESPDQAKTNQVKFIYFAKRLF